MSRCLYPPIAARDTRRLDVGDGHRLYVEEAGRPEGVPVVFLHGGPGSGCKDDHRRYFDPEGFRIVLLDQRGAGRSTPRGGLEANTTAHLIADLERVRIELGIERWVVFGGSWGATLALLYAQAHPGRVTGLILRATFLARRRDLDWFLGDGARRLFPEHWDRFTGAVPEIEHEGALAACHALVTGTDARARERAARAWTAWSTAVVTASLDAPEDDAGEATEAMIARAAIELHYAAGGYFVDDGQILRDIARVPGVPVTLVHGRRDLLCPVESSYRVHRALPGSHLEVLRTAGHLGGEGPMIDALVRATDDLLARLA